MRCHYEVLDLTFNATDDDIRKSYRRLALKWHPDKNLTNPEEAKYQFQLIQQAYEVLSDQQERAWYDKHRDSILRGGLGSNFKDDSINIYEYFTTSCFKGFGSNPKNFFSVYGEVFKKIAAEESEYGNVLESDFEVPNFGDADSSYDGVVHVFYSYWQSYTTRKTFSWLDVYDTRQAPNRKILRLMEKENKKVRDKARKERNEAVRALVAFVRKRDKRVIEHVNFLNLQALEKEKKAIEIRRKQIIKRQNEASSYVESEWSKFSNLEMELKEIEKSLAAEFKDIDSDESSLGDIAVFENFYCVACNKVFKTDRAFSNHEKSKRHRDNIDLIKVELRDSCDEYETDIAENSKLSVRSFENAVESVEKNIFDQEHCFKYLESDVSCRVMADDQIVDGNSKVRKKNKREVVNDNVLVDGYAQINEDFSFVGSVCGIENKVMEEENVDGSTLFLLDVQGKRRNRNINSEVKESKSKKKNKKKEKSVIEENEVAVTSINESSKGVVNGVNCSSKIKNIECEVCKENFGSKNALFRHLRESGHSVPMTTEGDGKEHLCTIKKRKNKQRK